MLRVPHQVFLRGSLLMLVADSPRRALVLCEKHPTSFSLHPCPYCMVSQTDDQVDGGGLGDPQFDRSISENRRTLGQIKDGWRRLHDLQDEPAAQRDLSRDLGLVIDDAKRGRPLYDKLSLNPIMHVPVERLHADALVSFPLTRGVLISGHSLIVQYTRCIVLSLPFIICLSVLSFVDRVCNIHVCVDTGGCV